MGGLSWADFTAKVLEIVNSRGHDYVAKATHPAPGASEIVAWYTVPVEQDSAGYVTKHGQRYELE